MQKKITVDLSKMVSKLWNEYDGDMNMKKWLKKESKNIITTFSEKVLKQIEITHIDEMELVLNEKEITITFEWKEKENIHNWTNEVKTDIQTINEYVWSIGLTAHYAA